MASKSDLDTDKLLSLAEGCRRVLVRLPDGLLHHAPTISDALRSAGIEAIISADACYGACDWSGSHANVDRIIYIGEAPMPSLEGCYPAPAVFLPVPAPHDVTPAIEKALPVLLGSVVGVVTITPYIDQLDAAVERLEDAGFTVIVGEKSRRVAYDGQILGCDLTAGSSIAGRVDCFLYIGDGMFHPLGLALTTEKPVVVANPAERRALRQELTEERDALLKRRYAQIARAGAGHRVGIVIGKKLGQHRAELAERLKEMAEQHGYRAAMVTVDVLQPERLDHLGMDFYVSTACPRVAIDDAARFRQPLLTPIEFEILVGERDWSEYEFDQIV
ncbi:MAG: diphthamide biosynthesis enzyme Dph2 [Thermoplasmatota archaeon]